VRSKGGEGKAEWGGGVREGTIEGEGRGELVSLRTKGPLGGGCVHFRGKVSRRKMEEGGGESWVGAESPGAGLNDNVGGRKGGKSR